MNIQYLELNPYAIEETNYLKNNWKVCLSFRVNYKNNTYKLGFSEEGYLVDATIIFKDNLQSIAVSELPEDIYLYFSDYLSEEDINNVIKVLRSQLN